MPGAKGLSPHELAHKWVKENQDACIIDEHDTKMFM